MKTADENSLKQLWADDIVVLSGIRPKGRSVDRRKLPRTKHGLLYIRSGAACFHTDSGETLCVDEKTLLLLPKGVHYHMQYTADATEFVLVNFELFGKNGTELTLSENILPFDSSFNAQHIANTMHRLQLCSTAQNAASEFRRKELLFRLLAWIYEQETPFADEHLHYPQILKGVLSLKERYLENIPIPEFAKLCGLSVSSFRDLFHKQYGLSPLQYRNRLRICRAKELLENGGCTVSEVAYASGFDNIGYFCNYYKKITGETPSQTKQRQLG